MADVYCHETNHYNTSGKTSITLLGCFHRQLVFCNFWNFLHGIFWRNADSNILLVVKLKFQHSFLQKDGNQHSVKASTFPWECYLCFMVVSEGHLIRFLKFSLSMHRLMNSCLEIFNLFSPYYFPDQSHHSKKTTMMEKTTGLKRVKSPWYGIKMRWQMYPHLILKAVTTLHLLWWCSLSLI